MLASDRKFREITRPREPDGGAVVGGIIAHRVDQLPFFMSAKTSHGIIVFQAEPERIDHCMAALAGLRTSELRNFFPHGQVRRKISVLESLGHGWRLESTPHDVARQKYSPMDR